MKEPTNITEAITGLDKHGLADRYMISIRTVEEWEAQGFIRSCGRKLKNYYNPEECDRRLLQPSNQKEPYEPN
jgi:hypothetical protein